MRRAGPQHPPPAVTPYEANLDGILVADAGICARQAQPTIRVTNLYNNGGASWTAIVEAHERRRL